jgi:hypothetical protein
MPIIAVHSEVGEPLGSPAAAYRRATLMGAAILSPNSLLDAPTLLGRADEVIE